MLPASNNISPLFQITGVDYQQTTRNNSIKPFSSEKQFISHFMQHIKDDVKKDYNAAKSLSILYAELYKQESGEPESKFHSILSLINMLNVNERQEVKIKISQTHDEISFHIHHKNNSLSPIILKNDGDNKEHNTAQIYDITHRHLIDSDKNGFYYIDSHTMNNLDSKIKSYNEEKNRVLMDDIRQSHTDIMSDIAKYNKEILTLSYDDEKNKAFDKEMISLEKKIDDFYSKAQQIASRHEDNCSTLRTRNKTKTGFVITGENNGLLEQSDEVTRKTTEVTRAFSELDKMKKLHTKVKQQIGKSSAYIANAFHSVGQRDQITFNTNDELTLLGIHINKLPIEEMKVVPREIQAKLTRLSQITHALVQCKEATTFTKSSKNAKNADVNFSLSLKALASFTALINKLKNDPAFDNYAFIQKELIDDNIELYQKAKKANPKQSKLEPDLNILKDIINQRSDKYKLDYLNKVSGKIKYWLPTGG